MQYSNPQSGNMKVLVTGARGSIGSHVIQELTAHGHKVRGFDLQEGRHPSVEWVIGDLADSHALSYALQGVHAVVHLAAVPTCGPLSQTDWWPKVWNVNVNGTFNLLWAMSQSGVTSLVYASSIVVPRSHGWCHPTPEELPYFPIDDDYPFWVGVEEPYTLSKQANELTTRMFVNRGLLHSATALRIAQVANATGTGGLGTLHTKSPSWTIVDIKDVAQAFRLAVEKQLPGHEAFFIGPRYRYQANGERQTPAETRAELAAAGLGNVPEKAGFLQHWQAISTSERAERMLGYNPRY